MHYYQIVQHYKEFKEFPSETDSWITSWFNYLHKDEIPKYTPPQVSHFDAYPLRHLTNDLGMWALVDLNWTKQLTNYIEGKVLEIMAGKGWLAKALSFHGVDIVATDNNSWHENTQPVFPVNLMSAKEAVEKVEFDTLLVSWPPMTNDITDALKNYTGKLIYIGETEGGCTANNEFFHKFTRLNSLDIPQWSGLHDYVQVGFYND